MIGRNIISWCGNDVDDDLGRVKLLTSGRQSNTRETIGGAIAQEIKCEDGLVEWAIQQKRKNIKGAQSINAAGSMRGDPAYDVHSILMDGGARRWRASKNSKSF